MVRLDHQERMVQRDLQDRLELQVWAGALLVLQDHQEMMALRERRVHKVLPGLQVRLEQTERLE